MSRCGALEVQMLACCVSPPSRCRSRNQRKEGKMKPPFYTIALDEYLQQSISTRRSGHTEKPSVSCGPSHARDKCQATSRCPVSMQNAALLKPAERFALIRKPAS